MKTIEEMLDELTKAFEDETSAVDIWLLTSGMWCCDAGVDEFPHKRDISVRGLGDTWQDAVKDCYGKWKG